MAITFQSHKEFLVSINEIDLLIKDAKDCLKDAFKYSILNKSALLLLLAKFENFLESALNEYIDQIKAVKPKPDILSEYLKVHSLNHVLNDSFVKKLKHYNTSVFKPIRKVIPLFDNTKKIEDIFINTNFNYGKHGHKEVIKLFKRIGIEDIFEKVKIYETKKSLINTKAKIDFSANINAMTNYRNLILHEDTSPSLTHQQIELYKKHSTKFSLALITTLKRNISRLKKLNSKKTSKLSAKKKHVKTKKKVKKKR